MSSTAPASSSGTTSRRRWPTIPMSPRASASPWSTRWPTFTCSTPTAVGLGDLGRPAGFVERQVTGWRKRWDLVDTGRVPQMSDVAERLLDSMPAVATGVSVLHNDYKIDNCQFDPADPDRVTSIFDWDMATVGEPLVDLGILLNYWPDPTDVDGRRPLHVPGLEHMGLPSRAEVVARYGERTGIDVSDVAVVRGVRHVEDVRRAGAALSAVRAGREHRPPDGRAGQAGRPARRSRRRAAGPLDRPDSTRLPPRLTSTRSDRRDRPPSARGRSGRADRCAPSSPSGPRSASPPMTAAAIAAWSSSISVAHLERVEAQRARGSG